MATGGYKSTNTTTDFLEEWKARREKMRAKMYAADAAVSSAGNVVISEGGSGGGGGSSSSSSGSGNSKAGGAPTGTELNNNAANPERTGSSSSSSCVVRSSYSLALRRNEEELQPVTAARGTEPGPGKRATAATGEKPPSAPDSKESERDATASPPASKGKEKGKSSGPSARKGKGQIEKRKLREKRRSTGVVSLPSNESPDEYDDDEMGQKERKRKDTITQQNTAQNEAVGTEQSGSFSLQETPRITPCKYKSTANASEDDVAANSSSGRHSRTEKSGYSRYNRDTNYSVSSVQTTALEKKIEELEKELAKEKQENLKLTKILQDKDDLIRKLSEQLDLLSGVSNIIRKLNM
ncbi:PRKC apoptosis WT1 regulator protein isoform X2 [Latimeria chalumnae]|uniref:PRKC apoptosis WT1 regulator protein isoform X2 n=1 Tax=Latimeria chalumnae TaxID=7897 RepID=UPI0006D938AC|nr:PREDICTED: PRKC apoptosis WT1 regulator protein isoform X2 [Latimeria chalumnae]|eukprot:XP_014343809.1 PREDICTED: PRKC apoptosis WT1 regulator protein isoform X2 [Latimeria chalumnae]